MISKSRSLLLAATLIAAPMGFAMAQGTTPGVNTGANGVSGDSQTAPTPPPSAAATNPYVPGATGQTVVQGSGSSMAGSDRVVPNPNAAATSVTGGGGH
ncbi:hypothetical protein [Acidisphaera sp. S103]|uniref:hypothetical protein n=1 Tax=Acidisphaera sp. S103 TaxID=1747223 RepID=UPI00131D257D|nr:hypothetical protein [Acidisphaera sp. S103]